MQTHAERIEIKLPDSNATITVDAQRTGPSYTMPLVSAWPFGAAGAQPEMRINGLRVGQIQVSTGAAPTITLTVMGDGSDPTPETAAEWQRLRT